MAVQDQPPTIRARTDALAIVAFICGLASFGVIPILGGVLAIVLGIVSRRRVDAHPELKGRGLGTTAMWLGIVNIVLVLLVYTVLVLSE